MRPADGGFSVHDYEKLFAVLIPLILCIVIYKSCMAFNTGRYMKESAVSVKRVQEQVGSYIMKKKDMPLSLSDLPSGIGPEAPFVKSISWNPSGELTVIFNAKMQKRLGYSIEPKLVMAAEKTDSEVLWRCAESNLKRKYTKHFCY